MDIRKLPQFRNIFVEDRTKNAVDAIKAYEVYRANQINIHPSVEQSTPVTEITVPDSIIEQLSQRLQQLEKNVQQLEKKDNLVAIAIKELGNLLVASHNKSDKITTWGIVISALVTLACAFVTVPIILESFDFWTKVFSF